MRVDEVAAERAHGEQGEEPTAAARAAPPRGFGRASSHLALAVAFLTILPVRVRSIDLGAAAAWFPAVGALIGAFAGAIRAGADPLFGATAATVLGMVALVVVTGALHQDGLADTADALGVRGNRERRLAVMRDSATGAFGVLALLGWALLLLAALAPLNQVEGLAALIAVGALSRWAALLHAAASAPARPDGLGAGFRVSATALALASAAAVALAAGAASLAAASEASGSDVGVGAAPREGAGALGESAEGGLGVAAALGGAAAAAAAALAVALLCAWAARRAVGGRTGDTIGATVAVAEVAVALTLLGFWR